MIPIRNIYYMMAYAFQALNLKGYRDMEVEEFENVQDLCAEILVRGMNSQIKRGLSKDYSDTTEELSCLRGKVELSESLRQMSVLKGQLVCSFDEFTIDTQMNRVIKSTLLLLLKGDVGKGRKKAIRKLMPVLGEVATINLRDVDWTFRFNRNNKTYRLLMGVCQLVAQGLLETMADGTNRLMDFFDDQAMHRLYEKFILEYYRREHRELTARALQIPWAVESEDTTLLPTMQTDITLIGFGSCLIIDAKYYSHNLQSRGTFNKRSIHSGNLYQIFTYVKNMTLSRPDLEVSGTLLYAETDEGVQPDERYEMSGNTIFVTTLCLDRDFSEIAAQLDRYAGLMAIRNDSNEQRLIGYPAR